MLSDVSDAGLKRYWLAVHGVVGRHCRFVEAVGATDWYCEAVQTVSGRHMLSAKAVPATARYCAEVHGV